MRRYYIDFINNKVVEDEQGYYVIHDDVEVIVAENEKLISNQAKRIAELESQLPKWISVKERLPKGSPMLPALTEEGDKIWWGNWHDGDIEIYGIAYWLDNAFPPPPTTKEK